LISGLDVGVMSSSEGVVVVISGMDIVSMCGVVVVEIPGSTVVVAC
jgi:hypothetical protein